MEAVCQEGFISAGVLIKTMVRCFDEKVGFEKRKISPYKTIIDHFIDV